MIESLFDNTESLVVDLRANAAALVVLKRQGQLGIGNLLLLLSGDKIGICANEKLDFGISHCSLFKVSYRLQREAQNLPRKERGRALAVPPRLNSL